MASPDSSRRKQLGLIVQRVHQHGAAPELLKLIPVYAKAIRADKTKNDPAVWNEFAAVGPLGVGVSPFAEYFDVIPTDVVSSWLWNQREAWNQKHQFITDEIARAVAVPARKFVDPGLANQLLQHFNAWAGEPNYKIPVATLMSLWQSYFRAKDKAGTDDPNVDAIAYELLLRGPEGAAQAAAFFKDWSDRVAKSPSMRSSTHTRACSITPAMFQQSQPAHRLRRGFVITSSSTPFGRCMLR